MEISDAVVGLVALAHEARLAVFRLLIPQGQRGLPAGEIGQRLGIPPNGLSFHLTRLENAHLVTSCREGRQIFYAANYESAADLMAFLTDDCCANAPEGCFPHCPPSRQTSGMRAKETASCCVPNRSQS